MVERSSSYSLKGDILEITFDVEHFDARNASGLKDKIVEIIQKTGCSKVACCLSSLQFIDSSGLGALLSIHRQLDGKLKLACVTPSVKNVFDIVSMDRIFDIYQTLEEAVQSFYTQENSKFGF